MLPFFPRMLFAYAACATCLSVSAQTIVVVDSNGNTGTFASLCVVDGNPAISYVERIDRHTGILKYVRARDRSGAEWDDPVALGEVKWAPTYLTVVNGNPAIAYIGLGGLTYLRAEDSVGNSWGQQTTVDPTVDPWSGSVVTGLSFVVVNGRPAIGYNDEQLRYVRANDIIGASWGNPIVLEDRHTNYASLRLVSGHPAIAYACGGICYIRASDEDGADWSDPSVIGQNAIYGDPCLEVVGGRPAISFMETDFEGSGGAALRFVRSLDTIGNSWPTPITITSGGIENVWATSMIMYDGVPAISYYFYPSYDNGRLEYVKASDSDGAAWNTPITIDSTGIFDTDNSLRIVNGQPAISYSSYAGTDLRYAYEFDGPAVPQLNVNISLYNDPTAEERPSYESIIRHFADGVYESSNGARKLGTVTFKTSGAGADQADIVWVERCHPCANVSGYGMDGLHVNMCDIFEYEDESGVQHEYDFLTDETHQEGGGYVLAHEWGHYYFSLYDEYVGDPSYDGRFGFPYSTDDAVSNSIMNNSWNAMGGDFDWLNFSVEKNDTQNTAQFRVYGACGWETLARPVSEDPRDANRTALPIRLYYPDLEEATPDTGQDSPIELPGDARSALNIVWDNIGTKSSGPSFVAQLTSLLGEDISYPDPILLLAFVHKDLPLTNLGVQGSVQRPGGDMDPVVFADNGVPPDAEAGDGLYSAIVGYQANGIHEVQVQFENDGGIAESVSTAFQPSLTPDGKPVPLPDPIPVSENFLLSKTIEVEVSGVISDDFGNTPETSYLIAANNEPVSGRIDYAQDRDVFELATAQSDTTYVRVSNVAMGMSPHLRVFGPDGTSVLFEASFDANYLFIPLTGVTPGTTVFAEVSDTSPGAAFGLYVFSAGTALAFEEVSPDPPCVVYYGNEEVASLLYPADSETGVSTMPELRWQCTEDAVYGSPPYYHVRLSAYPFVQWSTVCLTTETSCQPDSPLSENTQYQVHVWATPDDSLGTYLSDTAYHTFTTVGENPLIFSNGFEEGNFDSWSSAVGSCPTEVPILNSGFSEALSPWIISSPNSSGTATWRPEDAQNSGDSGSARLYLWPIESASVGLFQCVEVCPGETYRLEVQMLVPDGQPAGIRPGFSLLEYSEPGCESYIEGTYYYYPPESEPNPDNEWRLRWRDRTMSPGTKSLRIGLGVNHGSTDGPAMVYFDDVSLTLIE